MRKTQFETDVGSSRTINLNGRDIPYWRYQLPIHKRDLRLWSMGIKISRDFKVSNYKKYYGIKGRNGKAVLVAFMVIYNKYF